MIRWPLVRRSTVESLLARASARHAALIREIGDLAAENKALRGNNAALHATIQARQDEADRLRSAAARAIESGKVVLLPVRVQGAA